MVSDEQDGAQDEGHAPAPIQEGFVGEQHGREADDAGGEQEADRHADLGQAGIEGTLVGGRGFEGHEHGPAPFAAEPDALCKAAQDEQYGRPDADGCIGGDEADGDRGDAHDFQRQDEDLLAPDLVAEVAENHASQRTGHKPHRERGEGKHGPDARVKVREKELIEEQPGDHSVEEEVIPFDDGPEDGGNDDAAEVFLLNDVIHEHNHLESAPNV